jgi:hypothetical protein
LTGLNSLPASSAFPLVKDDNDFGSAGHSNTTVPPLIRGIYVGGAGNVAVKMENDQVVTFTAVPVGTILPIVCKQLRSTNTTATLCIGLL